MAKIVFLGVPAFGHVNPSLAVVQELVARGHEVFYYNTEAFRAVIEPSGAIFRPYPLSDSLTDASELQSSGNLAAVTALLLDMSVRGLPFVLDTLRQEAPDLVIYDSLALWGRMAATLLDLPSVASITHFVFDGTTVRPVPREMLRMIAMALPIMPQMIARRRRLIRGYGREVFQPGPLLPVRGDVSIMFTSSALQPSSKWIDDSFCFVGPSINPALRPAVDFPFDQLDGRPLIYISLGTIHHTNVAFYRSTFDAFADFAGQVVLSIGPSLRVDDLAPIPANFLVQNSVPQLAILQRADVFVTHGGMNSIHEALYYGVPLLVVPQQIEQALNGRIVVQRGAGLLKGGPFKTSVSSLELRAAVERILDEPAFREHAQALGKTLQDAGGYRRAADVITAAMSDANLRIRC